MGAFIWGMVGGAIVLMVNRHHKFHAQATEDGTSVQGFLGGVKLCAADMIANLKGLVAESKMEFQAEKDTLGRVNVTLDGPKKQLNMAVKSNRQIIDQDTSQEN